MTGYLAGLWVFIGLMAVSCSIDRAGESIATAIRISGSTH